MNIEKNLLLAATFAIGADFSQAQINDAVFEFSSDSIANYRQGPDGVNFEGATYDMLVRDGVAIIDKPTICNDTQYFPPSPPVCPLGGTGFISRGLDSDPLLRGLGPYFSVSAIAPATVISPFLPNSARLYSAPPSLLPRPLGGFNDLSLSVFYDLTTPLIRQYLISFYDFSRVYTAADRALFDGEIVPGSYIYNFASLAKPAVPIALTINHYTTVDGYRKINNVRQGFRFLNVAYDDGFAILDPFELNVLTWEGNSRSIVAPFIDNLFFSIKGLTDPTDPLSDPDLSNPIFPDFIGSSPTRVLLPSPLDTSMTLAPNFIQAGETGLIDMELEFYRPTSAVIFENTARRFRLPVKVLDPFAGLVKASLPPNATVEQQAADYDFDGDGVSNFSEWVFGSNMADGSAVPNMPSITVVNNPVAPQLKTTGPVLFDEIPETSQSALEYKVAKRTNAVPALKYTIEFSKDMITWTEITSTDPSWTLTETFKEIKITRSATNPDLGGFFRTKVVPVP